MTAEEWAEQLEIFRRSVDLRLDGEGRWFHEGEAFEHPGLIRTFDEGLDVHPDSGEAILRVGDKWCYINAEDTPFVVRRLIVEGAELQAHLNTGQCLSVPLEGFESVGDHVYVQLAENRRARLNRATQAKLADWLEEDGDGSLWVTNEAGRWPVSTIAVEP